MILKLLYISCIIEFLSCSKQSLSFIETKNTRNTSGDSSINFVIERRTIFYLSLFLYEIEDKNSSTFKTGLLEISIRTHLVLVLRLTCLREFP